MLLPFFAVEHLLILLILIVKLLKVEVLVVHVAVSNRGLPWTVNHIPLQGYRERHLKVVLVWHVAAVH